MPLKTDIDKLAADVVIFHNILHGPAGGAGSEVATEGGLLKTVARVLAEMAAGEVRATITITGNSQLGDGPEDVCTVNGALRLTKTGESLAIGVTPEAWHAGGYVLRIGVGGSVHGNVTDERMNLMSNAYEAASDGNWKYIVTEGAAQISLDGGAAIFNCAPSGPAGTNITWTEAARINTTGLNVLKLRIANPAGNTAGLYNTTSTGDTRISGGSSNDLGANIVLYGESHGSTPYVTKIRKDTTDYLTIDASGNTVLGSNLQLGTVLTATSSSPNATEIRAANTSAGGRSWVFVSSGASWPGGAGSLIVYDESGSGEKARWTPQGYLKASNDGSYAGVTGAYHELRTAGTNEALLVSSHNVTPTNQFGASIYLTGDPNNGSNWFLDCIGNATRRIAGLSNGGLANLQANDVNLSDATAKSGLAPAPSYWDFIQRAAASLQTGFYADDLKTHGAAAKRHTFLVAQDVERIDAGVIAPWQASDLFVLKGITEHEIQMRELGVIGELQRRVVALENHVGLIN